MGKYCERCPDCDGQRRRWDYANNCGIPQSDDMCSTCRGWGVVPTEAANKLMDGLSGKAYQQIIVKLAALVLEMGHVIGWLDEHGEWSCYRTYSPYRNDRPSEYVQNGAFIALPESVMLEAEKLAHKHLREMGYPCSLERKRDA